MDQQERIKESFERNVKALRLRDSLGIGTAVTTVDVVDGLSCTVSDGDWTLSVDMPEKHGGNNSGPNPGILGRGALGTCLAMGYARWAVILGVQMDRIQVEIHADYDARGEYAVSDISPTYSEIRYVVNIESDAPAEEINTLLDRADKYTSFLAAFRDPQRVIRQVNILKPETA